jgi:DNA-directed RNA polymerase specialized sigma24 family protein
MSHNLTPEELARLERAIANLPRMQREVLFTHADGLTFAEVGDRLGLSRDGARRLFARAIYNISRQMDGHTLRWWQRWL